MLKFIIMIIVIYSVTIIASNNLFIEINSKSSQKEILNSMLLKDIANKKDIKFKITKAVRGLSGVEYTHYGYTYKNIPVDFQTIVVSKKDGKSFLITGEYQIPKPILLTTKYTPLEIFKNLKLKTKKLRFYSDIKKVFLVKNEITYLAYKALVEYIDKEGYHLGVIYLDANTPYTKLLFESNIYEALNREVYDSGSECINDYYERLPGNQSMVEGMTPGNDEVINLAYINTGITYYFYKNMFDRDSFDDRGITLVSTVHAIFNEGGCSGQNAFFMGNPYNQMVYGEGGGTMLPLSRSLDITAHELTHAVTRQTSNLYYYSESGALNEAMSDIFGATVEAWSNSGGNSVSNPSSISYDSNTWKIGEAIFTDGNFFRDMSNPAIKDQPDHYSQRYTDAEDEAGVHINSGIINLAYYLLVAGGNHPRSEFQGFYPNVVRIGMEDAIKIFYEAEIGLFTKGTGFGVARKLLVQAAKNLYGATSSKVVQVNRAFDIVGVFEEGDLCAGRDADCEAVAPNSICIVNVDRPACACKRNYHWNGDQTECLADSVEYMCSGVTCNYHGNCTVINEIVTCECDSGYHNEGQIHCVEDGTDPCLNVDCDGKGSCFDAAGTAICDCDDNYHNDGYEHCVLNENNTCLNVSCDRNGSCEVNTDGVAVCICDDGYHNDGNIHCVGDEGDACEHVDCENNGVCNVVDGQAMCDCYSGYHNEGNLYCVEDDENACEHVNCENNGDCNIVNGQAICDCYNGYHNEGNLYCVKDDEGNLCGTVNCDGHGVCSDNDGFAKCICDSSYHNEGNLNCVKDEVSNDCSNVNCGIYGICEIKNGIASCACNDGYHDANNFCVKDDLCKGITCGNYGNCLETNGKAICVCNIGYRSENMICVEEKVVLCKEVSCSNHGSCAVSENKASCICESGYTEDNLNCIKSDSESCNYSNGGNNNSILLYLLLILFMFSLKFKKTN